MTANDPDVRHVRAVDDHFAGRISPASEAALRAHLPTCARCQRRYSRHLLLAKLDPRARSAEERLADGLGFARARRRRSWALPLGAVAVAAVALVLVVSPRATAPVPRGSGTQPALLVYRVQASGPVTPVGAGGERIGADDELAFAYANPAGRRYLLVYGQDEHGHVYWFHPGWPAGAPAPSAIAARPGAGPHELPEAVRHRFDGRRLRVTAIFSDDPLTVGAVERDGRALPQPAAASRSAQIVTRTLEVTP